MIGAWRVRVVVHVIAASLAMIGAAAPPPKAPPPPPAPTSPPDTAPPAPAPAPAPAQGLKPPPAPIGVQTLTDANVRSAIDAIVAELYSRRKPQFFWDPEHWNTTDDGQESQAGGYTALAALALLYAGQSYQTPNLLEAIEHLQTTTLQGTYAVAMRAHVWSLLPQKFEKNLQADAQWLLTAFDAQRGGWSYELKPRVAWWDTSLAQYGALGLWEAAKRQVPVDARLWKSLEDRIISTQHADGGWDYRERQPVTGSMTAAGLTILFITQDFLHAAEAGKITNSPDPPYQQAIDRGLRWMDKNFTATENPGKDHYFFYYLYGVERVGLASGYKTFGGHDWYREGAVELINRLCKVDLATGAMTVHARLGGNKRRSAITNADLSFALMFLSRGRVPVAINKLRIEGAAWNNRPRDVANLTSWISERTEMAMNWQIVDLAGDPRDWLDAPLLYVASHEALPSAAFEKIKRYVDLGGLVLAMQEGEGRGLAVSLEKAKEFSALPGSPGSPLQWRTLPEDHWAYSLLAPVRPGSAIAGGGGRPQLRGLSNGVRDLIIVCPDGDLPRTFQLRVTKSVNHYTTAANIFLAASEKNQPRPRLGRPSAAPLPPALQPLPPPPGVDQEPESPVTIVRAKHAGNWDPEPLALDRFAEFVADGRRPRIGIERAPLEEIDQIKPRPALVIVSGIQKLEFTEKDIAAIKAYVGAGGVILFETPGGRGEFTVSAEQAMAEAFNGQVRSMLRSRIVTGEGLDGAADLSRVEYRPFALDVFGARENAPRLRGIEIDGQPRILFSREDISQGLLDQPCWGIVGYSSQSARDLLSNIVLHATAVELQKKLTTEDTEVTE